MKHFLVRYEESFYYGKLSGLFVCSQEDLDYIKGREVYFGEVLGKHSEVLSDKIYENCDIKELTATEYCDLSYIIDIGTICGYNPIEILKEQDEYDNWGSEEDSE